jgi:hypothetical protein
MRVTVAGLVLLLVGFAYLGLGPAGCSSRVETAVAEADSTLVHPPKSPDGLRASITFCRKVSEKTGKPIGASQVFTMREKGKVRALVHLENPLALGERELMFHLVWIRPDGKEFYTKRIDLDPTGSDAALVGSISIPPGRRDPGIYRLQVFLFRELIAEKSFELRSADP